MDTILSHRSCYVNFAEHLQNRWNPNLYYPGAPNRWTDEEWKRYLGMLKSFGYNVFEFWLPPTLFSPAMIGEDPVARQFTEKMNRVIDLAHGCGIKAEMLCIVNTIGAKWYSACPNIPSDREMIFRLWKHWAAALPCVDIVGIFPGDPGGCNRNGCTHETFVNLALELSGEIRRIIPSAWLDVNTWGTPFIGWGDDMYPVPGWDGTWAMLTDSHLFKPGICHIWNGKPDRAKKAMEFFINHLPDFPDETMVSINLGFSPDGHAEMGGDARMYAREIAKLRKIVSWDYSASEGELINYPHWRLPRMSARRREETAAAPYDGGIVYTISPKLNLLTQYAGGQFLLNPDANPDTVSRDFCARVFGAENAILGELFEAFEVVKGWGHYPRRSWSRPVLVKVYREIIDRLEAADPAACTLPIFPDSDEYRRDLIWFARQFLAMAGEDADREAISREYRAHVLNIYDYIPQSVDERTVLAARGFSQILANP
jgi:hypothetical protein